MQVFIRNLPLILIKTMSDSYQAEDIRQLTEKVREQNIFFSLLRQEINKVIMGKLANSLKYN